MASILWAFSFGLIKGQMSGLNPIDVAVGRLLLAALAFSPFLIKSSIKKADISRAMVLGAIQFGLMYWLYIASYQYLPAWMVALFTVFTPLYVVLISDLLDRRLRWRNLGASLIAVIGALVVVAKGLPEGATWRGVLLLQGANFCFALGQVHYPRQKKSMAATDTVMVGWMYWGAFLVTGLIVLVSGGFNYEPWSGPSIISLLYLGLVPSALGFYLWNRGAARVSAGWLAVANNIKIPLAVLVSWLIFGETTEYWRALAGLFLILGSVFFSENRLSKGDS
ncbi:MAG: EamA family transporter [bacterium]|nr:EamA family transporter [bacterium]